jgi:hypothetical protein
MKKPRYYLQKAEFNCPEFSLAPQSDCSGYKTIHFHPSRMGHLHKRHIKKLIKYLAACESWLNK